MGSLNSSKKPKVEICRRELSPFDVTRTEGWKSEGNSEMTGGNCGYFGKKGEVEEGERRTERDERNGEGEREDNGMKTGDQRRNGEGVRREGRERVWEGEWSGGMKAETDGKECVSGWNRSERG